jgi:Cft2 family RNA processing exonuclease
MHPERFESWLTVDGRGLYCRPGGFHIDPHSPVNRAVITHAHSDHARPGHDHVLATRETLALMKTRLGTAAKLGTQITEMRDHVTALNANLDQLDKIKGYPMNPFAMMYISELDDRDAFGP